MGRKRTGTGKHILLCAAFLTCLSISGCASVDSPPLAKLPPQSEARQHLVRAQKLLAQAGYQAALEENQKALSLSANNPPGDEALYNMALIYAHSGNPKRDYARSIALFKRLDKDYPQSYWTEQGKVWTHVIQEAESARRAAAAAAQENDRLKRIMEESRKVDMEIEEMKREKAR